MRGVFITKGVYVEYRPDNTCRAGEWLKTGQRIRTLRGSQTSERMD